MQLVLVGLVVLVAGGVTSLLCSRAAKLSNVVGGLSAAAGSAIAAVPAVNVLHTGQSTELFSRPWQLPFAELESKP